MQFSPKCYGIFLNLVGASTIVSEATRWVYPFRTIHTATDWAFALAHIALVIPFLLLGSILIIKITATRVGIVEGVVLAYQSLPSAARIVFIVSLGVYMFAVFFGVL